MKTAKNYFHAPNENWIVDKFKEDWDSNYDNNSISGSFIKSDSMIIGTMTIEQINELEVVWVNAEWCWRQLLRPIKPLNGDRQILPSILHLKNVLCTIHHIVPEKFNADSKRDFYEREQYVTAYHVYNERVFDFVRTLTKKPLHFIKYWANQNRFKQSDIEAEQIHPTLQQRW